MTTPATLPLFGWRPPESSPRAAPQPENLARVGGRIGPAVLDFCRRKWRKHEEFPKVAVFQHFHAGDVVAFVERSGVVCAPASVDRILRDLRKGGFVSYTVVNRAASLYRIEWVKA